VAIVRDGKNRLATTGGPHTPPTIWLSCFAEGLPAERFKPMPHTFGSHANPNNANKKRSAEPSLSAPATSAKRHIRTAPLAGAPFWNAVSGAASDVQESDKDSGLRFCRKQQSSTLSRRFKLYVILPHFPLVASVVRPRWTGITAQLPIIRKGQDVDPGGRSCRQSRRGQQFNGCAMAICWRLPNAHSCPMLAVSGDTPPTLTTKEYGL